MRFSDWSSDVCSSDLGGVVERFLLLPQDEGNREIKTLETIAQFDGEQVARDRRIFVAHATDQIFAEFFVVPTLKRRMFDDAENVDKADRLLTVIDALAVLALQVAELGLAPHPTAAQTARLIHQEDRKDAAEGKKVAVR